MRAGLGLVAVCLYLCGCSFLTLATSGSKSITKTHEYVDAGAFAVTGFVCVLAAVAWAEPDAYAPVSDDPSSWVTPVDRVNVQQNGAMFTPLACTSAVLFVVSGLYGRSVRPVDNDPPSPGWAAAAAFANAHAAAQTSQPAPVYRAPKVHQRAAKCSSDFGCSYGWSCVKPRYSMTGVCRQVVNSYGLPTLDPPSTDSVGPNTPSSDDCSFDTDCPIGFRCDSDSGACMK